MEICFEDICKIKTIVLNFKKKCRYHKKVGEKYSIKQFTPSGFCPLAFASAYPVCLSLLYDAKFLNQKIYCPSAENYIVMQIIKLPLEGIITILLNLVRKIVSKFYPVDVVKSRIVIEIIESRNCHKGYKPGDKFEFNIGNKKEVCPAVFNAMYPFLRIFNNIDKLPWDTSTLRCPDDKANIVFEISKKNEK